MFPQSKVLVSRHEPKKLAIFLWQTMQNPILSQRTPNKNADLLIKISLMVSEQSMPL